jgi:hypothetical protein
MNQETHKKLRATTACTHVPKTDQTLRDAASCSGGPFLSFNTNTMEKQRECYRALLECKTRAEFNHVVTRYEDIIMGSEWLKMSVKSTLKRLTAVMSIKDIIAYQS